MVNRLFPRSYGQTTPEEIAAAAAAAKAAADAVPKTFVQADVDKMIAAARRDAEAKANKQVEDVRKQLAELSQVRDKSAEMETKIAELQNSLLTTEEKTRLEQEKIKNKFENDLKTAKEEASQNRGKFETYYVKQELLAAAVAADVVNAQQILDMLAGKAKVTVVDGQEVVKVPYTSITKEGSKVLELSPVEALAMMKEDIPRFGNLFKSTLKAGAGDSNSPGGGKSAPKDVSTMSPAEFAAWRKSGFKN